MVAATNLGFPRIGPKRELKKALESYWAGKSTEKDLLETARSIRRQSWKQQAAVGIQHVPSNDFSLYDQVLDAACMVGAVPSRYGWTGGKVDLRTYFAMARGLQDGKVDLPAMEMTKWFDTNYHYIVPELSRDTAFRLSSTKPVDEFEEALKAGVRTRPVLLGPVSFLLLGKMKDGSGASPLSLLPRLLPVYEDVLRRLAKAGATWVQVDEPCLALDLDPAARSACAEAFGALAPAAPGLQILVATYFGDLRDNLDLALSLPVAALHLDLVRGAPAELDAALARAPKSLVLSLGVVDGRNVWRTDLDRALTLVEKAVQALGKERVFVAPSCSLLHSPVDLDLETRLDPEMRSWFAFSRQKLLEVAALARAAGEGRDAAKKELEASAKAAKSRAGSPRIHDPAVKARVAASGEEMLRRRSPFAARRKVQGDRLGLPPFPTTTIGSFPQTADVRAARAEFRRGKRSPEEYEKFLRSEVERCVRFQEEAGLDVLVHGEFERNDMVEHFGEQLRGFTFTQNGWVQSYGSRCVKPPVIFGDVARPGPMTVRWAKYAQSLTDRPMKGMLTGPVTILQWSFVRDDQPRSDTCRQIALGIRDEVADLEKAGIRVVQIDEPAIREGLPLRRGDREAYLRWAVDAFRLASAGAKDETQVHTHMCYSEFGEILEAVARMDADVLSIETSRSQMELLDAFARYAYPNGIGPGVYDIHSPRVPAAEEMRSLLEKAARVLRPEQLWVNPDCGLKTRGWKEVKPALANMVAAARAMRG
jgi:5-methyltetrahydropteroyltriglutamate--homocysteine methyltransferase